MKAKVNKLTIHLVVGDPLTLSLTVPNAFPRPYGLILETTTDLVLPAAAFARLGTAVQRELLGFGYCEVGSAVSLGGGNTGADGVILTVGPRWGEGSERGKLANATFECLRIAERSRYKALAFPPISTGPMGYPLENCATTMLTQIIDYSFEDLRALRSVVLCLPDVLALDIFKRELRGQVASVKADGAV